MKLLGAQPRLPAPTISCRPWSRALLGCTSSMCMRSVRLIRGSRVADTSLGFTDTAQPGAAGDLLERNGRHSRRCRRQRKPPWAPERARARLLPRRQPWTQTTCRSTAWKRCARPSRDKVVQSGDSRPSPRCWATVRAAGGREQVQKHKTRDDCWIVLHGKVYNVSGFIDEHPYVLRVLRTVGRSPRR